jgi:hypothetical protein
MDMHCPGSEETAAFEDGRLDAGAEARLIEHAADCDDCRRTLALQVLPRDPSRPLPYEAEVRVLAALRRVLPPRERAVRPGRWGRRPEGFRAGPFIAAAAGLLVSVYGLVVLSSRPADPPRRAAPELAEAPVARPEAERPDLAPEAPPVPVEIPEPAAPPVEPSAAAVRREVPRPVPPPAADPPPREAPPTPAVTRAEEAPPAETVTLQARVLSEIQVTDAGGALTLRRKGAAAKETLRGAARLSDGDLIQTERGGSFHLPGRHALVLGERTTVSIAWSAGEQAPWVRVRSGEAVIDSATPTRWVLSDGRAGATVKPVQGRFAAAVAGDRFALAAVSAAIYVAPDGGRVRQLRPGQELAIRAGLAELIEDAEAARRRGALVDGGLPAQRTLLWTSFSPADQRLEQFIVQEGVLHRSEALLSRVLPDRSAVAAVGPNPRFGWDGSRILRFRYMTNAQHLKVVLRSDERGYQLQRTLAVERRAANQWLQAEIPLALANWGFQRDDGQNQLTVGSADLYDSLRFTARQQDVFGDQKVYVLLDEIQVVDPR